MDSLCVERDSGWSSHPSIPISEADGVIQADSFACDTITNYWTGSAICSGESRELRVHLGRSREGAHGFSSWEYTDRTSDVARITTTSGDEVLAS